MQVKRTEHKFILNSKEYLVAKQKIEAVMPKDSHCTSFNGYEIRSLYFDTLGDRACAEKEDGMQIHEKIRIRIYGNSDSVIKLESKRKDGEFQVKKSMLINRETFDCLCKGNYGILLKLDDPMAQYFYHKLIDGMMPKAIIQYNRMSYCVAGNNTRITFDFNIRATESNFDLFSENLLTYPILSQDQIIMEVKFNNFLFGYIKTALSGVKKSATSFSKYYSGRLFQRYLI